MENHEISSDFEDQMIARLVHEHLDRFSYSNVQIFTQGLVEPVNRRTPSISCDPPTYCLQHNELILRQLQSCGFSDIKRMSALVVNRFEGQADDKLLNDTVIAHNALLVNDKYIVDVGFAENSLRGPLPFRGVEEDVCLMSDMYRFKRAVGFNHFSHPNAEWWGVHVLVDSKWFELWRFPCGVVLDESGLVELNESLTHAPRRVNVRDWFYLVAKVTPTKRLSVRAFADSSDKPVLKTLTVLPAVAVADQGSYGLSEKTSEVLETWDELVTCLRDTFNQPHPPESVRRCFYGDL
jgi:arylamine N-acetyltransferase